MKQTLPVLLLVLFGTVTPAAEPPLKRLNILFFTSDDMNFDSSGVCGGPIKDLTPNLDRLASEGLRFEFAYSTVAVCPPVRQTMQAGLYNTLVMSPAERQEQIPVSSVTARPFTPPSPPTP